MKNMIEICRRCNFHEESGVACGPVGITAVNAEIVVEADGQKFYLLGQWEDMSGEFGFEATKESLYDILVKDYPSGSAEEKFSFSELDRIRAGAIKDDAMFQPFYDQLTEMIHAEMKAHDIDWEDEDEEE